MSATELQRKLQEGHEGANAKSLQDLEDANLKLKAKVQELTGLLDDSHKEKVELNRFPTSSLLLALSLSGLEF